MAGRPTNRDERHEQVMHALVRCVARYGLDGVSLSQIAAEAGLSRPLIRHHLGNRADIIAGLTDFVLKTFADQTEALLAALPMEKPSAALVDLLFSEATGSEPDMVLAFAALTARAMVDRDLQAKCRASLLSFEAAIARTLRADFPQAGHQRADAAAHGITAVYFNRTSLAPLHMPESWQQHAKLIAVKLLEELEQPS